LRPTIGKSIVVAHIKRVCIIAKVVSIVHGMLKKHLLPLIVCFVEKEELLSLVVDDILGEKKWGLAGERLWPPSVASV